MDELSHFDYELPAELIAQTPLPRRDGARLLVVDRRTGKLLHERVENLPQFLRPGDCLVLNDTRVIPARLRGFRAATGGKWEGLFLGETQAGLWTLMGQTRGKLTTGERIVVTAREDNGAGFELELCERGEDGTWTARCHAAEPALELLARCGEVPLPPYMGNRVPDAVDEERYQTTYARAPGAVAAPTAGLHFTPQLLESCRALGVATAFVTLHVGVGTFRPISVERLSEHRMHSEWCELSEETAAVLNATRAAGGRVVCVGTTAVRTVESASREGRVRAFRGWSDLFIRPGYRFRTTDCLLTNFHLPRSTLFVLVCTLAGRDTMRAAYAAAIDKRYRFYSYGDAMLIV